MGPAFAKTVEILNSSAKASLKEIEVKMALEWLTKQFELVFDSHDVKGIATVNSEGAIGLLLDEILGQTKCQYLIRPDGVIAIRQIPTPTKKRAASSPDEEHKKYLAYSRGLVKHYDSDKDGRLNSEEVKKMRSPPPVGADANKDGFITVDEFVAAFSGRKKK